MQDPVHCPVLHGICGGCLIVVAAVTAVGDSRIRQAYNSTGSRMWPNEKNIVVPWHNYCATVGS